MGFGDKEETSIRHGAVDVLGDEVGVSVKAQPVAMDKVELEEVFDLGVIEIGVSADEPDDVDEFKVSGTESSKESPVVSGLSEVSGVTITEIIAGADVKAKGIRMSGETGMFVDTGRPPGRLLGG